MKKILISWAVMYACTACVIAQINYTCDTMYVYKEFLNGGTTAMIKGEIQRVSYSKKNISNSDCHIILKTISACKTKKHRQKKLAGVKYLLEINSVDSSIFFIVLNDRVIDLSNNKEYIIGSHKMEIIEYLLQKYN